MQPTYSHNDIRFYAGHVLDVWPALAAQGVRVQTVITSIPYYGLRSYGTEPQVWGGDPACSHEWADQARYNPTKHANPASYGKQAHLPGEHAPTTCGAFCTRCDAWRGELGQEPHLDLFVAHIVAVFRAVRPALRPDGTLWINIGDTFGPDKSLIGIPWLVAFALKADGWLLRSEVIWHKTAPMPESVQDRFTRAHEQIFVFSQRPRYFMDMAAIREPQSEGTLARFAPGQVPRKLKGPKYENPDPQVRTDSSGAQGILPDATRNPRDVWTLGPDPYADAHFATFPREIPRRAILAGTSERGACPACGAAWQRVVERETNWQARKAAGCTRDNRKPEFVELGTVHGRGMSHDLGTIRTVDRGWQPGCRCSAGEPVPCLVADPFLGSGTSAEVAYTLGRGFVGGDLKAEYLQLAIARMQAATPWYARADTAAPVHELGPLFAGVA